MKSIAGFVKHGLTVTIWSWSRLSRGGLILVHGGDHGSLEACFASARRHRAQFGQAPIAINLKKSQVKVARSANDTLAIERDALIAKLAEEHVRRALR